MAVQRGRSQRRADAYPRYVEALSDASTPLTAYFSILREA